MEISHLKARQSGLQEELRSAQSASAGPAVLPVSTASSIAATSSSSSASAFLTRPAGSHHGFHGDEVDISDVLWSQQEINRLSSEIQRLEAEASHWRRISQVDKPAEVYPHF